MIRVRQIKVAIENDTSAEILKKISKKLNTNKKNILCLWSWYRVKGWM